MKYLSPVAIFRLAILWAGERLDAATDLQAGTANMWNPDRQRRAAECPPYLKPSLWIIRVACAVWGVIGLQVYGQPAESSNPSPVLPIAQHEVIPAPVPKEIAETNAVLNAPEPGSLPPSAFVVTAETNNEAQVLREFQLQLELAQKAARGKKHGARLPALSFNLLETNAPNELKRKALFELALVNQDDNQLLKAQQIFSQYLKRFPDDPSTPEIVLRQGLLYRQMGVPTLAISKFYAVMSMALKLNLSNMDYYKKLVLQAQSEIADTYYQQGEYAEAADFFTRLLKADDMGLNKPHVEVKLIRSLSSLEQRGRNRNEGGNFS